MLEQVCAHIHNYFISAVYPARYSIESGMISPAPSLKEGQRFWLCGSDLNDGVYTYHESGITNDDDNASADLQDEVFSGTVCGMAVPKEVLTICGEISDWNTKYAERVNGPYQSESFNGYSYTLKSGSDGNKTNEPAWASSFGGRLQRWRKACL